MNRSEAAAQALRPRLVGILQALDVAADDGHVDGLLQHLDLMARWNRVYNLTAVRDKQDMLTQHFADCLAAVPPLRRHVARHAVDHRKTLEAAGTVTLLDAGSGAGLPGLVLARMCSALAVTCVDTVGKKAAFVQQVIAETGLSCASAVHGRVEDMPPGSQDIVVARAYASLTDLVHTTGAALRQHGVWMAMKGRAPDAEMNALDTAVVDVFHVEHLTVPGLSAERCIVWMRKR